MKFLKKNQIILYVIALMLVTAGYLNYSTTNPDSSIQVTTDPEELAGVSNLGDAQLVNSNITNENQKLTENKTNSAATEENQTKENTNSQAENQITEKTTNTTNGNTNEKEQVISTSSNVGKDNYFVTSKLERDTMYSQMLETYEKVLNSSNSLETQKQTATDEITKINQIKNSIMICENLIKTKGFEQNIVFVNGDSVSVIIGAQEIKPEEVAQIQNIVSRELTSKAENIHIATK